MRAARSSPARKPIQPRSTSPVKRKVPKTPMNLPKFTHFFFVLKSAKQLHQLTSKFLTATIKLHPNLLPLSSVPVLCHHSQVDFNYAFSIDLSGSNVADSPELFSPKITISTTNFDKKQSVATAVVPLTKSKAAHVNGRYLMFLCNHQDVPLKLLSSPKIGGYINVTCAFGSLDHRRAVDQTVDFFETSIKQLQQSTPDAKSDTWKLDATENGWVPPEKAAEIWQRIAREHGWKPPVNKSNLSMHSESIEVSNSDMQDNIDLISFSSEVPDLKEIESDNDDESVVSEKFTDKVEQFVNFALAAKYSISSENVFDQQPKKHDFSQQFTVFEMEPEWQCTDSDADLNRDLNKLLADTKKLKPKKKLRSLMPNPK